MDTKVEITTITPKYVPLKCPVCNGFGTVKHGELVCGSCDGKGYILVEAQEVKK